MMDSEEQETELLAMESIFENDDNVFSFQKNQEDCFVGQFAIHAPEDINIKLECVDPIKSESLKYVPPVYVTFTLPIDYPSNSSPIFTINCQWLSVEQVKCLWKSINSTLQDNSCFPVLFASFQAIKETIASFFATDNAQGPYVLNVTSLCSENLHSKGKMQRYTPSQLYSLLVDYDSESNRLNFEKSWFTCQVCLDDVRGLDCLSFDQCNHVFCVQCIREYFAVLIKDGTVHKVGCLASDCDTQATSQQVHKCVDDSLSDRFDALVLSNGLDVMPDMTDCPRPQCGHPVILESDGLGGFDPMGACALCSFNFCIHCRKGFHGIAPCSFTKADRKRLVAEYEEAAPEVRRVMEKMYGKQRLNDLLNEAACEEWVSNNAKACPHCRAKIEFFYILHIMIDSRLVKISVEKSDGCNKMVCCKCGSYFCWLCLTLLNPSLPYGHFNNPQSTCFNLLFQGVDLSELELMQM